MAAKVLATDDSLKCPLCSGNFVKPKLLRCYHTFCLSCLNSYMTRTKQIDKFDCPLCGRSMSVPKTGADGFQNNIYILKTDSLVKGKKLSCSGCDPTNIAQVRPDNRCLTCEDNFCSSCTKIHLNMKVSRHHKLIELKKTGDGSKQKAKIKSHEFCPVHPSEEIKCVCKRCDEMLCALCMITKHRTHKLNELSKEASEARHELSSILKRSAKEKNFQNLGTYVENIKHESELLPTKKEGEMTVLKTQAGKVHQAVDTISEKKEKQLALRYGYLERTYSAKICKYEMMRKSWISLMTTAGNILELETDTGIVERRKTLYEELRKQRREMIGDLDSTQVSKSLSFTPGRIRNPELSRMIGGVSGTGKMSKGLKTPSSPSTKRRPTSEPILRKKKTSEKVRDISPFCSNMKFKGELFLTSETINDISSISCAGGNKAWISSNAGEVCLLNIRGKVLMKVSHVANKVCFVCSETDNSCLVACSLEKSIKRITTTGILETIVSSTDGYPQSIACRKHGDNDELLFTCTNTSHGEGTVFTSPQYFGSKSGTVFSSGYQYPSSIAVDHTSGLVCVGDRRASSVTVLQQDGTIFSRYEDVAFDPWDVCFDNQGCILVSSGPSQPTRRIRKDGQLVEKLLKETSGFFVSFDPNGCLWICCMGDAIRIYQI